MHTTRLLLLLARVCIGRMRSMDIMHTLLAITYRYTYIINNIIIVAILYCK